MIEFKKVSFSYGIRPVIKDLDFFIRQEERVAILGGSGDGKTTILKLILGLLRPDSGRVIIDGEDITDKRDEELMEMRRKLSIVFQEGALFDSLNVKENVAFGLREYTMMTEEEIDQRVRELLKKVGLEEAMYLMPEELSGGMHRRVAIMRSIAAFEPNMFLYDEPTAGLDPANADIICRLILDLSNRGKGFIVVTHKIFDALKLARRFMILKDGKIIFDGERDKILQSDLPEVRTFLRELKLKEERDV